MRENIREITENRVHMTFKHSPYTMAKLDIHSLISDMPGFVIIKDLESNYLNANLNTVNEFNLKNSDFLCGYSDLTIPHPISQNGQFYRNLDLEVIETGKLLKGICTFPFQGSVRAYHFRKSILKDLDGNNIATYSHAVVCEDPILVKFIHHLLADQENTFGLTHTTNSVILNKDYHGITLSPSESCCLFYLMRQKSVSEIAGILNLSTDAIVLLIEKIKIQLNANNIRDIVDLSLSRGYINIIPPDIFNQFHAGRNHRISSNNYPAINSKVKILHHQPELKIAINLTHREMDCARLLIKGKKIKEIASAFNLSPRTVETHINNLKMKLDCRDKVGLIIKLRDMLL